ncbi:MAG: Flp pilus assembly complex ATPase component TadA [Candidatus Omnitrophica bacterium]|nr:Flp pilus assembly complex ATPase component TadA [Candidatus Omnitrophota bacterium]
MKHGSLRLGEMLIEEGIITQEHLDEALREQKKTGELIGSVIIRLGYAKEGQVLEMLSKKMGVSYVSIKDMEIKPAVIGKVSAKYACYYKIMPIEFENNILSIAVTNPLDLGVIDDIKLVLGYSVNPVLSGERDILEGIKKYYGVGAETIEKIMDQADAKDSTPTQTEAASDIEDMADDASIIKFVNQILQQAVSERATDIHIEPFEGELRVRYRVDGVLFNASIPPTIKYLHSAIVSRIKIMSSLNIAERRLPQDGRIKLKVKESELDLRVSTIPTSYGESVHIRILSANVLMGLESLGLLGQDLGVIEEAIRKPHGIVFVTGPTGSGKTTTLYACLSKINDSHKNIITIEDPIEYQLHGVTQIQVNPKIGLTFAAGLRSMLRHDPDIMMVGEVRDLETSEITIRVALTGHLVFSTLHTNDACGAVTRLLDMGIEPYLVSSSAEAVVAQRLVRLICEKCKKEIQPEPGLLKELKISPGNKALFYEGKGCASCRFTGFKGRTAIYEVLVITDNIRDMILKRASASDIKTQAVKDGMRTLFDDGMVKVSKGSTTISEVLRVTEIEGDAS